MSLATTAVDLQGFRAALGSFASTVNVITFWDEFHRPRGMTATAFSSVSASPPQVLVCINRSTRTYTDVISGERFGINMLGVESQEISDYCARAGADKDLHDEWLSSSTQWSSPALRRSLAFLDCKVVREVHAGTHAILIGEIDGIGLHERSSQLDPLVYYQGAYRTLQGVPERTAPRSLPILLDDLVGSH